MKRRRDFPSTPPPTVPGTQRDGRQDPVREDLGRSRRSLRSGRARPALHRPPSGPRGHFAAGVRVSPARRSPGPPSRPHPGDDRPRCPHRRPGAGDPRPALEEADRHAGRELPGLRHHPVRSRRPPPGDRARHRPRTGHHPAGDDDRLRRQPHRHSRRLRGAGVRHRHLRGGARARHPDAAPDQAEGDEHRSRRRAAAGGDGQGRDLGDHRPDGHRRRHRARDQYRGRRSAPCPWRGG